MEHWPSQHKPYNMTSYFKFLSFVLIVSASNARAQSGVDSTGLPGDNFSLQGALQMFKKASSPEDFEKLLNTQDNNVNNLDLNDDGQTDYINVIDKADGNNHAFVLQVAVSPNESQDIAVIELEKTGDESASLQIVGDEDLYGEEVIAEPDGDQKDDALINGWNSVNSGPSPSFANTNSAGIIVNVWFWPSVRFVYGPVYRPWISPWRWNHYPGWWRPWRPFGWAVWHPRCAVYHRHYVIVGTHRAIGIHNFYRPYRTTSVTFTTRHANALGNYRVTRTRTTVTGPHGRSATRTTTTVRGERGRVKATKTTVRRHH